MHQEFYVWLCLFIDLHKLISFSRWRLLTKQYPYNFEICAVFVKNPLAPTKVLAVLGYLCDAVCLCAWNQFARGVYSSKTINMYVVIIYRKNGEKITINIYKQHKLTARHVYVVQMYHVLVLWMLHFLPAHVLYVHFKHFASFPVKFSNIFSRYDIDNMKFYIISIYYFMCIGDSIIWALKPRDILKCVPNRFVNACERKLFSPYQRVNFRVNVFEVNFGYITCTEFEIIIMVMFACIENMLKIDGIVYAA